jgi:hypothetical protein
MHKVWRLIIVVAQVRAQLKIYVAGVVEGLKKKRKDRMK